MKAWSSLVGVVAAALAVDAAPSNVQRQFNSLGLDLAAATSTASSTSASSSASASSAAAVSSATVDGKTFVNHGLVAFGRIPDDAVDSLGESLGGLGSAIALESFSASRDGKSYSGKIRLQPDRGHNQGGEATSDYRARSHLFDFSFAPLKGDSSGASSQPADENLKLTYRNTLLYKTGKNYTTGLDPDLVRDGQPPLPYASYDDHLAVDAEGLVIAGPLLLVSDEYGPYVYAIERSSGQVIRTLAPPAAIVPTTGGKTNFTALADPTTGRAANRGFEGLTLDRTTGTLWALLQSATVQDGGSSKTTQRYTRLLGYRYDAASLAKGQFDPQLAEEYVVELPVSKKGKARGASELHVVGDGVFLILPRDGNGFGDTDSDSSYKNAALLSTKGATNIAGGKYDQPENPVAPDGKLVDDVTAIKVQDFVDLVDKSQLKKFGLHTGGAIDSSLIASKLESLALASVGDRSAPDDYYLFVVSDNDFITTSGKQAGQTQPGGRGEYVLQSYSDPYAQQYGSQDTQAFVYRVTLPGYDQPTGSLGPN